MLLTVHKLRQLFTRYIKYIHDYVQSVKRPDESSTLGTKPNQDLAKHELKEANVSTNVPVHEK